MTPIDAIYNSAVTKLARREHSQQELKNKLLVKFPDNIREIELVLAKLIEQGYQSDERYAEAYIRTRRNQGFGRLRICHELRNNGVAEDLFGPLLREPKQTPDTPLTDVHVYRVWQKKFSAPPENLRDKQRQVRYLVYRGFAPDEIQRLFELMLEHS